MDTPKMLRIDDQFERSEAHFYPEKEELERKVKEQEKKIIELDLKLSERNLKDE